jgi:hypothetical protein
MAGAKTTKQARKRRTPSKRPSVATEQKMATKPRQGRGGAKKEGGVSALCLSRGAMTRSLPGTKRRSGEPPLWVDGGRWQSSCTNTWLSQLELLVALSRSAIIPLFGSVVEHPRHPFPCDYATNARDFRAVVAQNQAGHWTRSPL